jgi:transposase InsO family protein
MRARLRSYATKNPCHGFRRAWAALRYDARREVNKKKIHRLWREEGLQDRGWQGDQDCLDGRRAHSGFAADYRGTLDHRRSACRRAQDGVRRGRRAAEGAVRMDKGPEFISQALQRFCDRRVRMSYIPPGTPWNNGHIESFDNRLRKECLNRNHWNTLFEARVVIGDFREEHNHRHRHSSLGYRTPAEYAAACRCTHTPVAREMN